MRADLSEELEFQSQGAISSPGNEQEFLDERIGNRQNFRVAAALALALLAPALGGGTSPAAVAVLLAGAGLAAIMLPARTGRGFLLWAGLMLVATLDWALPARLLDLPWRERLGAAGFPLSWCSSPEPWMSLRAWLALIGGLVWAGWCAGQDWTRRDRRMVSEGLAVGIGIIALVALSGWHVPGWPVGTGLGPFENRNQTALLFAVGGFLTVACGVERARKDGRLRKTGPASHGASSGWVCWACTPPRWRSTVPGPARCCSRR